MLVLNLDDDEEEDLEEEIFVVGVRRRRRRRKRSYENFDLESSDPGNFGEAEEISTSSSFVL